MKAIVFEGTDRVHMREMPLPEVKKGWALVKVAYAGICGSDITIYHGKHPRAKAPLIMGHEFSGTIASEDGTYPKGTRVVVFPYISCGVCGPCNKGNRHVCQNLKLIGIDLDGGMAEYAAVPEEAVIPLEPGLDLKLAAFIEPVGIAVHVARQSRYLAGDTVVIFGAGAIGLAVALTLRRFGAEHILISEPNPERIRLAASMGFDVVEPGTDILDKIRDWTGGQGADYVYDCAGHQSVIDLLPDAVKINGKIVIVAGYKNPPTMDFQKGMFREFTIQFVRNCTRKDFQIAAEIINEEYAELQNCVLSPEEAEKGFAGVTGAYKIMFSFM